MRIESSKRNGKRINDTKERSMMWHIYRCINLQTDIFYISYHAYFRIFYISYHACSTMIMHVRLNLYKSHSVQVTLLICKCKMYHHYA